MYFSFLKDIVINETKTWAKGEHMEVLIILFIIAFVGFIIFYIYDASVQPPSNSASPKEELNKTIISVEPKTITVQNEVELVTVIESKPINLHEKKLKKKVQPKTFEMINGHKVSFIHETHEYIVDGKSVLSVSDILKRHASFFNINDDYANIPEEVLRRAAEKGTKLHSEIEDFEKTGAMYHSIEFKNYLKLKRQLNFSVKESEKIILLYSSSNQVVAAGRMDMLVDIDGVDFILDIKRTSRFYRAKVTAQTNLYKLGYNQTYGGLVSKLMCMRLREFEAEIYHIEDDQKRAKEVLELL